MQTDEYKIAVIGGGLAGLTLAIQAADAGYSCVLFEKNKYPFHKVCGEYISKESWNFLERCGMNLSELNLPEINRLLVSSPSGKYLKHQLDLGGFGISRHLLDHTLSEIAKKKGVLVLDECRVNNVEFDQNHFKIESSGGDFYSELCVGAWGKKSNMDTRLGRRFIRENKKNKNYVGIKYHVLVDFPGDLIELHNFENGYCGISKIENGKYCLCYLTDSENLKRHDGNIKAMEETILMENPFLKNYFSKAKFLFDEPLAISQISIGYKNAVENNILMLGDTAGNIAPLSGNGMSMAMRSSFIVANLIREYFDGKITRRQLEDRYEKYWRVQFKTRVEFSKFLQKLLKNKFLTNCTITVLKYIPFLRNIVVKSTHGNPF